MPAISESCFKVRFYECDAYGHVNHANYLRYMQEAAFDASTAAGYNPNAYESLGYFWLVRETGVVYHRPLVFGDTVAVKTWVSDFRRATSRRNYELRVAESGELAAEGYSDWVFLSQKTGRPSRIPAEMAAAFGGTETGHSKKRKPFAKFPPPPAGVFRLVRRARWSEIDPVGHVNNAAYLSLFEDAAMELMAARGWSAARLSAENLGIIAREFRIEYNTPAVLDDELEVATWVSDVRRATVRRYYAITRLSDGQRIARAEALWVWVHMETGRPMRIPQAFLDSFADNVS